MKTPTLAIVLALSMSVASALAQLSIPAADGSDGPLNATNTPIDLSQAIPGDALTFSNSGGLSSRGIFDAERWVVVYKYSSVSVPSGVTVTFINHPSGAPVVWLVQGTVTIAGTVSVNGKGGVATTDALLPVAGGPGGFRGGATGQAGNGYGMGPGGAVSNSPTYNTTYGNPPIRPLIGGSGAGGSFPHSGSGGGGAILIATPGLLNLSGNITALGGLGSHTSLQGSGGAIKLIANEISGGGSVNAAQTGRVRIEAGSMIGTLNTLPTTINAGTPPTPILFQSSSDPSVRIKSVAGNSISTDPRADLLTTPDANFQNNSPVLIEIETKNFPVNGSVVRLRITGKYGATSTYNAVL